MAVVNICEDDLACLNLPCLQTTFADTVQTIVDVLKVTSTVFVSG